MSAYSSSFLSFLTACFLFFWYTSVSSTVPVRVWLKAISIFQATTFPLLQAPLYTQRAFPGPREGPVFLAVVLGVYVYHYLAGLFSKDKDYGWRSRFDP